MANPEHVEVVKQGSDAIAKWRIEYPGETLDLTRADLRGADLEGVTIFPGWAVHKMKA